LTVNPPALFETNPFQIRQFSLKIADLFIIEEFSSDVYYLLLQKLNMSELITEYFTCKICSKNHTIFDINDRPSTCNSCWLKMEMWQKYDLEI